MKDQRSNPRAKRSEDVFLEIEQKSSAGGSMKYVLACESIDISADGMQLYVNGYLETQRILTLCVRLLESGESFMLQAEVRWCRHMIDAGWYFVGLTLLEADDTDIDLWREYVSPSASHTS